MSLLQQRGEKIQAQRIRDALDNGENIDLYDVRILGDLSSSDEEAERAENSFSEPKHIKSQIIFNSCIFEGSVKFVKTVFLQEVSFGGSHFKEDVAFWPGPTEFQKAADFSFTHFCGRADFNSVKFKDDVTFKEALFSKDGHSQTEFSHAIFDKDADFVGSIFKGKAIFLDSRFRDSANFSSNTKFKEDVQFDNARFYETPRFYNCKFCANAGFNHVTFYRDAIFIHSTFEGDFSLIGSRSGIIYFEGFEHLRVGLEDLRDINKLIYILRLGNDPISKYIKSKFSDELKILINNFDTAARLDSKNKGRFLDDFNEAIFSDSFLKENSFGSFQLSEMTEFLMDHGKDDPRLNRLIIEDVYPDCIIKNETLFGIKMNSGSFILLDGSHFGLLKIHWPILKKHLKENTTPSVYLSLIRGYHELGWTNDEDECYFYYRSRSKNKISRAADRFYNKILKCLNLSKCLDPIASISCGYGVYPGRTISLGLGVILAFAFLYWAKCTFWLSLGGDGLFDRSHLPANVTVVQFSNGVFQANYYPNNHMTDISLLNSIYDIPNAVYLSAMIFISQVPSNWYVNGYWKYAIMFERIAGWLLMALFIVVLTKKLIR